MGFILMYDVTNEESFNSVQDWYQMFFYLIFNLIFNFFLKPYKQY
jgi:hypothetical protein